MPKNCTGSHSGQLHCLEQLHKLYSDNTRVSWASDTQFCCPWIQCMYPQKSEQNSGFIYSCAGCHCVCNEPWLQGSATATDMTAKIGCRRGTAADCIVGGLSTMCQRPHLGATWTWAPGNAREKGPTKSLCSTAKVGSTICSTGSPSSFTNLTHSLKHGGTAAVQPTAMLRGAFQCPVHSLRRHSHPICSIDCSLGLAPPTQLLQCCLPDRNKSLCRTAQHPALFYGHMTHYSGALNAGVRPKVQGRQTGEIKRPLTWWVRWAHAPRGRRSAA